MNEKVKTVRFQDLIFGKTNENKTNRIKSFNFGESVEVFDGAYKGKFGYVNESNNYWVWIHFIDDPKYQVAQVPPIQVKNVIMEGNPNCGNK